MRMRIVLVVLGCLAAAGCSLAPPKTWKNNYALRPLQPPPEHERAHEMPVPATLRVAAVDAPTWLAGRDMYYQLTYSSRDRVSIASASSGTPVAGRPSHSSGSACSDTWPCLSQYRYWRQYRSGSSSVMVWHSTA